MDSSTSTPTSAPDVATTPRAEGNHAVKSTANSPDEAPSSEEIWVDGDLVDDGLSFAKIFEGFQELSTMPLANDEQKRQLVGLSSQLLLGACRELAVGPEHVNIDWQELYNLVSRPTFLDAGPSDRAFYHGRGSRPGVFALKRKLGGEPSPEEQQKASEARAEDETTSVQANTGKRRAAPPSSDSEEETAAETKRRPPKRAKTTTKKVQKAQKAREERAAALGDEVHQLRAAWKAKHPDRLRGPAGRPPPLDQLVTVAQADADIERMRYEAAHYLASDPVAVAVNGGNDDDVDDALLDTIFAHRTVAIPLPTLNAYQMALGDLVYEADPFYCQVYLTDASSPADAADLSELDAAADEAAAEQRDRQTEWEAKGPSGARAKALRVGAFRAKYLAALRFRAVLGSAPSPCALRAALRARLAAWCAFERAGNAADRYALSRLLSTDAGIRDAHVRVQRREINLEVWQDLVDALAKAEADDATTPAGADEEKEEEGISVAPVPAKADKSGRYSGKILTVPRFEIPKSRAGKKKTQRKGKHEKNTFAAGGPPRHDGLPVESNWDRLQYMIIITYWRCLKAYEGGL